MKLSVIIPFYQHEKGILRRALESVLRQHLPADFIVEVIVVDDGSPVSAQSEVEGLTFAPPFHLNIISQANAGVAAARNTGLKAVDVATKYIAFLDSDDNWRDEHLAQGIEALERGYDLYFCDNCRGGVHASHFASCGTLRSYVQNAGDKIIPLPKDAAISILIKECPAQTSTIIYRRECAPELLFDTSLKYAGEDKLFTVQLGYAVQKICFSPQIMVDCGTGVNLYFSHMDWDSPENLKQVMDDLKAHYRIRETLGNLAANNAEIKRLRRKLAFLALRRIIKNKGGWPPELQAFARDNKGFYLWFGFYAAQVAIGRALGLYSPS